MKPELEIIESGLASSMQDMGRTGWREFGVAQCGIFSPAWLALANKLVGNAADVAAIEFRITAPTLRAKTGAIKLCVCGDVIIKIGERKLHGWQSFTLAANETAEIKANTKHYIGGVIGIGGGVDVAAQLGSKSTDLRAALGGWNGRLLVAGDVLPVAAAAQNATDLYLPTPPKTSTAPLEIRIIFGAQDDYFSASEKEKFLNASFTKSLASDRMGTRLDGATLSHNDKGTEIISDGIAAGAVQVSGNGQPIVLLHDAQTTGGYPKLGCVLSADLPLIANAAPDTQLKFSAVSADEGAKISRAVAKTLQTQLAQIKPIDGALNLDALNSGSASGAIGEIK